MTGTPPIALDEEQRLEDLRKLDLLLTTPEEVFDRLTSDLARIFEVSGVALSFMDRDTQYVKSGSGPPGSIPDDRTEPRAQSVCNHVLTSNQMLVVEDLLADERFRDNPVVVEAGARFYAGTPLRADSGRPVGTLCIIDGKPRTMSGREQELLRLVADGVMAQVKLQAASRQLLERSRQIERDHGQAVHLQRFLLPPARSEGPGWRITHLYVPFEHLGGDFIDVHRRADDSAALLLADVSGHGTSAALTAAMAKTSFHRLAPRAASPADLLGGIHRELAGLVQPGQFMTAMAALFDAVARQVTIASAGHPPPMLIGSSGRVEVVAHDNEIPLFLDHDGNYAQQSVVDLPRGSRLLLYTDGATDAAGADGKRLGVAGFAALVEEAAAGRPAELPGAIMAHLRGHAANRFADDVAILCLESV